MVSTKKEIMREVVNFSSNHHMALGNVNQVNADFLEVIPKVIIDLNLKMMTNVFSMEEVKKVVFSFGAFKALHLDGFPLAFF